MWALPLEFRIGSVSGQCSGHKLIDCLSSIEGSNRGQQLSNQILAGVCHFLLRLVLPAEFLDSAAEFVLRDSHRNVVVVASTRTYRNPPSDQSILATTVHQLGMLDSQLHVCAVHRLQHHLRLIKLLLEHANLAFLLDTVRLRVCTLRLPTQGCEVPRQQTWTARVACLVGRIKRRR